MDPVSEAADEQPTDVDQRGREGLHIRDQLWNWPRDFMGGSTNVSDASLKSPPEDASTEQCLQMLRQVSARTYARLDLEPGKSRIGFIAQEVQSSAPQAFGGLIATSAYSSSRGDAERDILTLDYARLVCPLWQSCKAMLARIELLEARVAQLSAPQ